MSRKRVVRRDMLPDVRVHVNPVTHEKEVTVLDDVQRAFEKCRNYIDGQRLTLSNADGMRLVLKLQDVLERMLPHQEVN